MTNQNDDDAIDTFRNKIRSSNETFNSFFFFCLYNFSFSVSSSSSSAAIYRKASIRLDDYPLPFSLLSLLLLVVSSGFCHFLSVPFRPSPPPRFPLLAL